MSSAELYRRSSLKQIILPPRSYYFSLKHVNSSELCFPRSESLTSILNVHSHIWFVLAGSEIDSKTVRYTHQNRKGIE